MNRFFSFFNRRQKQGLDFKRKKVSVNGLISLLIWVVSVTFFLVALTISTKADGRGDMLVGIFGITAWLFNIVGLCFAFSGMNEREVSFRLPVMGGTLNAGTIVFLLVLFMFGLI